MDKLEVRKKGLYQLEILKKNRAKKQEQERLIRTLLFASKLWQEAKVIGMYRALPTEFDMSLIQQKALFEGKIVAVPKSLPDRKLAFFQVDAKTNYHKAAFNIEEPLSNQEISTEQIDLLLVPGVVFSTQGYRIGYGGGYYDRLLTNFKQKTCSLVFSQQINNDWQPNEFDLPVQRIFTDHVDRKESL